MATTALEGIGAAGANASARFSGMGAASDRDIDGMAGGLSQALTGGGKSNFESPGEQQNFNNGLRDAVRDMAKGAERAAGEGKSPMQDQQFQDGMKNLIQLLEQLVGKKGEGKDGGGEGSKGAEKASGAGGPGGGEQAGGEDDMIKKLIALLKQMGMSDKDIAALLGKLGVPAGEINQALQAAGQADGGSGASAAMGGAERQSGR